MGRGCRTGRSISTHDTDAITSDTSVTSTNGTGSPSASTSPSTAACHRYTP